MLEIHGQKEHKQNQRELWLAGGCFWGAEQYLGNIDGVDYTLVGYANSMKQHPSYEDVCTGQTHAAEAVYVIYDTNKISLEFLLELYYKAINPTSVNKQGGDIGTQYRTGIYYTDATDVPVIKTSIAELQETFVEPIAIEVLPLENFYVAEAYHQKYLEKNPSGYCHIPQSLHEYAKLAKMYQKPDKTKLKDQLTDLQYKVTQEEYTERPFENEYNDLFDKGIYVDITTGQPLFISTDKFESGCGWPSFSRPIHDLLLEKKMDYKLARERVEVRSHLGDAHLGHVFNDGPQELGGLRYCINSAALRFVPFENMDAEGYGHLKELFKD